MNKPVSRWLHLLLAVIVAVELAGRLTGNVHLEYFVKPLIMIWMTVFFLIFRRRKRFTLPVLTAFFFSWIGDILLMMSGKNELLFYLGVGGFFFAQLAYIYSFSKYSGEHGLGYLQKNPITSLLFIAYAAGIYYLLYPGLEGMMKPIILVYSLSLIGMSMMALNRMGRVSFPSYLLVFAGSILFVISDSMIAFNKFYMEFSLAGFWIMATYIAAQYLIMRGLILAK